MAIGRRRRPRAAAIARYDARASASGATSTVRSAWRGAMEDFVTRNQTPAPVPGRANWWAALPAIIVPAVAAASGAAAGMTDRTAPAWLYPASLAAGSADHARTPDAPQRLPGSAQSFTAAELTNMYRAVDWRPSSHGPLPEVVARGREPALYACGYCHLPAGQGRPENASLAGLPADYIVRQVASLRDGTRRAGSPSGYLPTELMIGVARAVTDTELNAAAAYFAAQHPVRRVRVVEAREVPKSRVAGFVYVAVPGAGREPLGRRLLEFTPDLARHEQRDDRLVYVAYAPPGSIRRGRELARTGAGGRVAACTGCHGTHLQGSNGIPALAGRSPSYLLRALYQFRAGQRDGEQALPMLGVVSTLDERDLLDAVAYAASLPP